MINTVTETTYHNGNGSSTDFAYPFRISVNSDLQVYVDGVLQSTGYSVSGAGGSAGGTVAFNSAPASGTRNVVLQRVSSPVQESAYPEGTKFSTTNVEADLDKLVMLAQETKAGLLRRFGVHPIGLTGTEDFRMVENAATRSGRSIVFTDNGLAITVGATAAQIEDASVYAESALQSATEAAASAAISETAAGLVTTKGDIVAATGNQTLTRVAVGTDGKVLAANSSASAGVSWETPTAPTVPVPPGAVYGFAVTNASGDPTHDITVAVGECASIGNSSARIWLESATALTKRLDATWASGTGNGMRSSSVALANAWYHIFVIKVGSNIDIGADTSLTAANLIADHSVTHYRRIFSIVRSGGAIRTFLHKGEWVWWKDLSTRDFASTIHALNSLVTLSTPSGLICPTLINMCTAGGSVRGTLCTDSGVANTPPNANFDSAPVPFMGGTHPGVGDILRTAGQCLVTSDANSQVLVSNIASFATSVQVLGYLDERGRSGVSP